MGSSIRFKVVKTLGSDQMSTTLAQWTWLLAAERGRLSELQSSVLTKVKLRNEPKLTDYACPDRFYIVGLLSSLMGSAVEYHHFDRLQVCLHCS